MPRYRDLRSSGEAFPLGFRSVKISSHQQLSHAKNESKGRANDRIQIPMGKGRPAFETGQPARAGLRGAKFMRARASIPWSPKVHFTRTHTEFSVTVPQF
jgi:hypothetical protein